MGNRSTKRYYTSSNRRRDRHNKSLVNRIENLIDVSSLMDWKALLEENNMGKLLDCTIDSTCFQITIGGAYLGSKWNRSRNG